MRTGVALIVTIAAIAAVAASVSGTAAASHRAPRVILQSAASPSWSPDGKQLIFSYVRYAPTSCCGLQPSRYRIVRTSARPGRAFRTIYGGKTPVPSAPMAWAAGGRVLFEDGSGNGLKSVGVHDGNPTTILSAGAEGGPEDFILSPNRQFAAVTIGDADPHFSRGLALVELKPGQGHVIVAEEQGGSTWNQILGFSPDGRQLVFSRSPFDDWAGPTGPWSLMAISLAGGEPVPLAQSGIPGASLVPSDVRQAQWSPDGRWVAFVKGQSLEVVSTAGGAPPRVLSTDFGSCALPGDGFSWAPTSKVIAYDGCPDQGNPRLVTVRPDGTDLTDLLKGRRLTFVGRYASVPQWSPDASRLVFLAHRFGHRTVHVWTIRANGRDLTERG